MDDTQETNQVDEYGQPSLDTAPSEAAQNEPVATPEQAQPKEPQFVPDQWALNYKGQRIVPKDRQHLINLAQQGHGYSQRMEEIKKQAQELEQRRAQYSQYEQFDQQLKANPELAQRIVQAMTQGPEGQQQLSPEQIQLRQAMDELDQLKKHVYDQKADAKIMGESKELKSKYKTFDWNTPDEDGMTLEKRVIKNALDKGIAHLPLEVSLRDLMFDHVGNQAQATALKTVADKRKADMAAGKVISGNRLAQAPTEIGYKEGDSYNELVEKALKLTGG